MRINTIKPNDVVNGNGIMVSIWTQGCPHHCKGCFNPETWSFTEGEEFTSEHLTRVREYLDKDGVHRNLSILGGEPLCEQNVEGVKTITDLIKMSRPQTKIYVWSGYTFEHLISEYGIKLFENIDFLIDGKFEIEKKDITLKLRGSYNQRVINIKETIKAGKVVEG